MKYGNLTLGQVEALVNKIGGMTVVERILQGSNISAGIAKLLEPANDTHAVTVDYGQSLELMIAAGRYDWKNDNIKAKHFPIKGEGKVDLEITLVHYNRVMSTDDVLKDLDQRGLRPAKIEELLALGASQTELQREFPIIALGSVWRSFLGYRYCPYLHGFGSERDLSLGRVRRRLQRVLSLRRGPQVDLFPLGSGHFIVPLVPWPSVARACSRYGFFFYKKFGKLDVDSKRNCLRLRLQAVEL